MSAARRTYTNLARLLLATCLSAIGGVAVPAPDTNVVARPAYQTVQLTGFTRARATLPLVAEASGKILEVSADIGATIGADGLFARIDPTFIQLDLDSNRVQQDQLRTRIAYDERETKRYKTLVDKGSASPARLDELEQTLRDNRLRLKDLAVQARILEERLARTRVAAPAGWQVTARTVEPGQRVNEGEVLGEAADFSTLLIPVALTPQQLAALQQHQQPLRVQLPDHARSLEAQIYRINPGFDAQTRKIAVDLVLEVPPELQRGGLRAVLSLRVPAADGAVVLPAAAVEQSYEEYWVTRDDGTRIRVVRLDRHADATGDWLQVASPRIRPGDRFRLPRSD